MINNKPIYGILTLIGLLNILVVIPSIVVIGDDPFMIKLSVGLKNDIHNNVLACTLD